ncbi:hypothetical protein CPB86DRAFT_814291 [Serendipita vermifera]|nr:hypothetical protein CPB86DRAFT_814291 [Serendipita vermifera]
MDPYRTISFQNTSQYSAGGPSACGLASANAVRAILSSIGYHETQDGVLKLLELEETAVSIMQICSFWNSSEHLDVEDILQLPLFTCQLDTVEIMNQLCSLSNFRDLIRDLITKGPSAAIITKTPEIVAVIHIPHHEPNGSSLFAIFDSHPRPKHPLGAAFLLFRTPNRAADYLSKLFQVDESLIKEEAFDWQSHMLGSFSAHILRAREATGDEQLHAIYAANIEILNINHSIKEATERRDATETELKKLREKLEEQREARKRASAVDEEAAKKLRILEKELESARSLVKMLNEEQLPMYQSDGKGKGRDEKGKGGGFIGSLFGGNNASPDASRSRTSPNKKDSIHVQKVDVRMNDQTATYKATRNQHAQNPDFRMNSEAAAYEAARTQHIRTQLQERVSHQTPLPPYEPFSAPLDTNNRQYVAQSPPESNQRGGEDRALAARLRAEEEEAVRRDHEIALLIQAENEAISTILISDRVLARQLSDEGFECEICMEHWSIQNVVELGQCKHRQCRECVRKHITSELESNHWPIVCSQCKADAETYGEINRHIVDLVGLEPPTMEKWNQMEWRVLAQIVECPKCKHPMAVDREDYNATEMMTCTAKDCRAYWCKKCSNLAERGKVHSCDGSHEYEEWTRNQKDAVRLCPGCGAAIQRDLGCHHMTCTVIGCNTHFCDQCGKLIIKSHKKKEIERAVRDHYRSNCQLFNDPGSEDERQ